MSAFRTIILVAVLFVAGCDSDWVTISQPIGEKVTADKLTEAVGRWCDQEDGIIELHVSSVGELVAGNLSWDDKNDKFVSDSFTPVVRELGGNVFLFATEEKETIVFLIERPKPNRMEFFLLDPAACRNAVASEIVTGEIILKKSEHFRVHLIGDTKLETLLSTVDSKKYFSKEPLLVYNRSKVPK